MKIIDAHTHIYETLTGFGPQGEARAIGNGMVEWATGQKERFLPIGYGDKGFSPQKLIELMDDGGIDKAVILQGSNYGFQNSYISEAVSKYSDRFVGAGTFDPYCLCADDIFINLTENLGFKNIKFEISQQYGLAGYHPDLKIDGKLFDRYFSMAEEKGITVTIDTGTWGTSSFQTDGISRVIKRHKNLSLVVAHCLFPEDDKNNPKRLNIIKKLSGENIYFDIANLNSFQKRNEYFRAVMDIVGADHMIWGTDCPGIFLKYKYAELTGDICNSGYFSKKELEMLMYGTAAKVYNVQ